MPELKLSTNFISSAHYMTESLADIVSFVSRPIN